MTEIMWLGAGHLLQQVDISVIPVLSSMIKVMQSARDLGVIPAYCSTPARARVFIN